MMTEKSFIAASVLYTGMMSPPANQGMGNITQGMASMNMGGQPMMSGGKTSVKYRVTALDVGYQL